MVSMYVTICDLDGFGHAELSGPRKQVFLDTIRSKILFEGEGAEPLPMPLCEEQGKRFKFIYLLAVTTGREQSSLLVCRCVNKSIQ